MPHDILSFSLESNQSSFRQLLILSTLAQKPIKIINIRSSNQHPGISDYESSFLRLLEKLTNGCIIEISYTGTSLYYRPGIIIGGKITHSCPSSRAIGYFLEPLIALAPFAKLPLQLTLLGITNDNIDVSVDSIRVVLLPQLKKFGIDDDSLQLKITKRGAPPLGGGEVYFSCPIIRSLNNINHIDDGKIKRIRGIAYAARTSPQIANRTMDAARTFLTRYIPDVYIYTDVYKGQESGKSPGYALTLVAETTTGCLLSSECAFERSETSNQTDIENQDSNSNLTPIDISTGNPLQSKELNSNNLSIALINDYHFATPEDLGTRTAKALLSEIKKGGCVDTISQWIHLLFMALGPEDVGKVRFGGLSPFTIQFLRHLKTFLGVFFKIEADDKSKTVLLTGMGTGYTNVSKKVT